MDYSKLCSVYQALEGTSKGLEKTAILADFLAEIAKSGEYDLIYLLQGKAFADYDKNELGMSLQLVIRAISRATGLGDKEVVDEFRDIGDLGKVAESLVGKKKQQTALFSKKLTVEKVLQNVRKLPTLVGAGTVDRKIGYVVELLNSASPIEARYIVRTVLSDLKVGVGNGLLRDAIVEHCFDPQGDLDEKKEAKEAV
ncbi:DNA ligase, partial [archaeon]|nr:DNA ligase [archaeon]